MNRRLHPISLHQAAAESPTLAKLAELARDSNDRLEAIQHLIPDSMRAAVRAGPIDGMSWCILVTGNAAAAKLRQLLPAIEAHLGARGWEGTSIRLKVQMPLRSH